MRIVAVAVDAAVAVSVEAAVDAVVVVLNLCFLFILCECGRSTTSRRRLPVIMFRLKFTQSIKQAVTYIEQVCHRVYTFTINRWIRPQSGIPSQFN